MSLIIMVGLPYSGKSTFVDILSSFARINSKSELLHVVRPSDWYDDIQPGMNKSEWQINCWQYALEKTTELLANPKCSTSIIIFDTCGTSPRSLSTIIAAAQLRHHKIISILIATPKSICCARGDKNIVDKYIGKVTKAIAEYQKISKLYIIKDADLDVWRGKALDIAKDTCLI